MNRINVNQKRLKALCLGFLMLGSWYTGSASAGIIIDSITANFSSGAFFKLEFDDTKYGPLPYGPANIDLAGVTGLSWVFTAPGAGDINVSMSHLQLGDIAIEIDELGVVSLVSFYLDFSKGDLTSVYDYALNLNPRSMSLDYCPYSPTGTCNEQNEEWSAPRPSPVSSPYSIVSRTAPTSDVPEPMTLSILLLGLLGILASRKIRKPEAAQAISA